MKTRLFLPILILTIVLLVRDNFTVGANPELPLILGLARVTEDTNPGKCRNLDHMRICWESASVVWIEMNDPRLTGEVALTYASVHTQVPYRGRFEGDFRLDNQSGSWVGSWMGTTRAGGYTSFHAEAEGRGDYEGLVARLQMTRSNANWLATMSVNGEIFAGRSRTHGR